MHESTCSHPIVCWRMCFAISQQQLQLFFKWSKVFIRAIVDICICKGDFRSNYFLQGIALSEYLQPQFSFAELQFLGIATVKRIYLKYQIFVVFCLILMKVFENSPNKLHINFVPKRFPHLVFMQFSLIGNNC